jgi:hypothetical protein
LPPPNKTPTADEEVTEDFRGRVHSVADDSEAVDVEVETDEDFRGRVRSGEKRAVTPR